jgi:hypothetical protein
MSRSIEARTTRFHRFVAAFASRADKKLAKQVKFDARGNHSWEEVQAEAAKAVEKDRAKLNTRSILSLLRRGTTIAGRAQPGVKAWLDLLPDPYGSVLAGGLLLIFGAAAHVDKARTKILSALACLPDAVEVRDEYMEVYHGDATLARCSEELYMSILVAVEGMLEWLDSNAWSKHRHLEDWPLS